MGSDALVYSPNPTLHLATESKSRARPSVDHPRTRPASALDNTPALLYCV